MAGLIHSFIGHQEQKNSLLDLWRQDHWPSSFIFTGPNGVGKKTLVRSLLQVVNCDKEELACGQCSNCVRSLEEKNELVFELKPETKKVISVDQVREIHQQLSLKMVGNKVRFVIVSPADKLSSASANALLKVLEEPPPQTYFFLITHRISRLLPTLRSRSQTWTFQALSPEEMSKGGKIQDWAIRWSGGSLNRAQQIQTGEGQEYIQNSLKLLYSLLNEPVQDWKKVASWFFSADEWREFSLEIWAEALRQKAHGQDQGLEFLPQNLDRISSLFENIQDLQKDLEAHVDKQLALDNFYYQVKN